MERIAGHCVSSYRVVGAIGLETSLLVKVGAQRFAEPGQGGEGVLLAQN